MDMFPLLASLLLFALWCRSAAVMILRAMPEDEAIGRRGPEELHLEFRRLSALVCRANGFERWLVCMHYRCRRLWYGAVEGWWPKSARQALQEMRKAVVYLAREAAAGPAALQ